MPVSVGTSLETGVMAKALSGLFAAGATLSLLSVLLPHNARASAIGLLTVVGTAYVIAAWLYSRADTVAPSTLRLALYSGTAHITAVAYFSAEHPSPLIFFYLWVFLYGAYFFTRRQTLAQVAFVAACYASILVLHHPPSGFAPWWLVGMGSLSIAAILIGAMRTRAEQLIDRLYETARTDPLTQLLNRRGFRELLDLELERARRSHLQMAVLAGDVDHYKQVNDRSGHHMGDAALRRVAQVLERCKRQVDVAARVGGEEFALILPDTDEHGAYVFAERVRLDVEAEFAGDAVPITISFGVATYPHRGETAGAILRAGDDALYGAKEDGRNCTVLSGSEVRERRQHAHVDPDVEGERYTAVVLDLAEVVDLRFSGSARHSETVGRYAETTARELGLNESHTHRVRLAGILHDVGKVAISDEILSKPGKLTEAEWQIIRTHPELGAQILDHASLADVREWVRDHHERPDGAGYPAGKSGAELSQEARILAVADAYEAMTSDRSYRSSIGGPAARDELRRGCGTQFDARVVGAFIGALARESERALALPAAR
jgi:diguanylate cyclase (GGDEF)-like protein/putative nucleotidyltransferase with HDIG domain